MTKLLIVEDDLDIVEGLTDFLEAKGFVLDFAYRGDHALNLLEENKYDMVLLDVNLPGVNGLQICHVLKQKNLIAKLPVIMMTANDRIEDKLLGFESGAWDYLVKPFSLMELVARINVFTQLTSTALHQKLYFADLMYDQGANKISSNNQPLPLHATGLLILGLLIKNAPDIVFQTDICAAIWGEDIPDSEPLRAHVYKLRQILKICGSEAVIQTTKGLGYKLCTA